MVDSDDEKARATIQYILKLFYFYLEDYRLDNPRDDEYLSDSPDYNVTEFMERNKDRIDTFLQEVKGTLH